MVIGAEPNTLTPTQRAMAALGPPRPAGAAPAIPPIAGAVAGIIFPGMIVTLVRRENHPFIWWAFGAIPLTFSVGRLVLAVGSKVEK
jgi:hypothetical protein